VSRYERWVTCIVDERAHAIAWWGLDSGRNRYKAMCGRTVLVRQVLPRSVCGNWARISAQASAVRLDDLIASSRSLPGRR